ncbi:hypothetical protein Ancab_021698, partial [Ancistrocladus abbreviatus]
MEKKHFSHDHPLLEVECRAELCAGCRSDINGVAFGCKGCSFYLHKFCAKLPRELRDPLLPSYRYELEFYPLIPEPEFHCYRCCHRIYKQGLIYVTYTYDEFVKERVMLHVDCALLFMHPYHEHSLVHINERKLFSAECVACGAKFHENEHEGFSLCGCHECGDAFHKECLDLPAQVKRQVKDPNDLSRYLDVVPWDYNELNRYFCDGCKE